MNSMVANQVYKAYNRASHTVAKTKQIVMLYDGALRFLAQAREATEQKDIETRYHRLVKVNEILMGLQASLDFEAGGTMANVLYDFYSNADLQVFNLHQENDPAAYDPLMQELRDMRDVWKAIDENELEENGTVKTAGSDQEPAAQALATPMVADESQAEQTPDAPQSVQGLDNNLSA